MKWLPHRRPATCIFLQTTAEMTDFPIPAFPHITITRFWEFLSSNQFSTLLNTHSRVSSWKRWTWNSMSPLNSDLTRFLRTSSPWLPEFLPLLSSPTATFISCTSVCKLSKRSSWLLAAPWMVLCIFVWVWCTFPSTDMLSWSFSWSSSWVWRTSSIWCCVVLWDRCTSPIMDLLSWCVLWSSSWVWRTSSILRCVVLWDRRSFVK